MNVKTDLVRLKITLDDVKPVVMRRIVVPIGIKLDRLHAVMQAAMGWTNSHLWEFRACDTGWGPKDPDGWFGDGQCYAKRLRHGMKDGRDLPGRSPAYQRERIHRRPHEFDSRS